VKKGGPRGRPWLFPGPDSSKFRQANPNQTKQMGLDRLGFIRANPGFSIGYGESKSEKSSRVSRSAPPTLFFPLVPHVGFRTSRRFDGDNVP
jgi:hypothetical protein